MGDWSGSATLNIGVFRNGQWLLDCNGRGVFGIGVADVHRLYTVGQFGDAPVAGGWSD